MANLTTVGLTAGAGSSGTGTVSTLDNVIGAAGTANTNVQTVQGIASMTPLLVNGSGVTQPVSMATNTPVIATGTNTIGSVKLTDGTTTAVIKAASTAPVATDPAVVVAISPNSVNANISDGSAQTTTGHTGAPVVGLDPYSQYETVAASASAQVLGATGAQYDYLAGVLIIPATSAAGVVSITDGNGSAITVFAGGGTTALADLKPFLVPLGLHCLAATTPGWKVTTGTNVSAIGIGKFT